MTTVKILGEGGFGLVDLVLVDVDGRSLLCVRKKLLKHRCGGRGEGRPGGRPGGADGCILLCVHKGSRGIGIRG